MCMFDKPKLPKPVVVPPPPVPPPPLPQNPADAASGRQSAPSLRQRPQRVGASALRNDLTIPLSPVGGNGLSIPR
jgi:hypothetical protein